MNKIQSIAALAAATILLSPALVSATPCPPDIGHSPPISDNVTPSTACELGDDNNDNVGGASLDVNDHMMFGFTDWEFAQRDNDLDGTDETNIDIGLSITGDMTSGDWSIDDVWASLGVTHVMLVFKGGNAAEPDDYVGYLITFGATSGTYLTPFSQPGDADAAQEISHISAYIRRDGGMRMPEPGTTLLFGLGLLAVAAARRRF